MTDRPRRNTPLYAKLASNGPDIEAGDWRTVATVSGDSEEQRALRQRGVIVDISPLDRIRIEGTDAASLVSASWEGIRLDIGSGTQIAGGSVYRVRRDLYVVVALSGHGPAIAERLAEHKENATGLFTITDIGDGQSQIWLAGPAVPSVLGRLCALDFHDAFFPHLACRATEVAKTTQLILREDRFLKGTESVPAYSVIGDRSLAVYLWETALAAGHDIGLIPAGWRLFAHTKPAPSS